MSQQLSETSPVTPASSVQEKKKKASPRPKKCYMLHHPETLENWGRYVSSGGCKYSSLKAVSRNPDLKQYYLRETGTRLMKVFEGELVPIDPPQVAVRNGRTITYAHRPRSRFIRSFVYHGDVCDDTDKDAAVTQEKTSVV